MILLLMAANSLRRLLRDRRALFFLVLLPFFIILVIGSVTKNLATSRLPVGVVNRSHGPLAAAFVGDLKRSPALRIEFERNEEDVRRAVRRGREAAGVVIPATYDRAVSSGRPVTVLFFADALRPPTAVRAAVASAAEEQGAVLEAADVAHVRTGVTFATALRHAREAARLAPPVGVRIETPPSRSRRDVVAGFAYTVPSQLVLFVFLTGLAAAGVMAANRQLGVTARIFASPTRALTIVAGELVARFATGAVQALYIVALGVLVFGVDLGDPVAASVLLLVFVLVTASCALLLGSVLRNPEQAQAIVPSAGIATGMLAGCMWPRQVMPVVMQRMGQLFPQAWAMDGFLKLIAGGGLRDIVPQLAVLFAFVAATLPVAAWRLHRSIVGST